MMTCPAKSGPLQQAGRKKRPGEINCFDCQHFYITHDPMFPYGCRSQGFKSRLQPSKEVYMSSGVECLSFAEKNKR